MNGIILIDKEKNVTSRMVVDKVAKILHTKHIGHTGTLDPLATGLMVLCVNEGCKLVELLTGHDKEYVAKVRVGIKTDTYDITGNILERMDNFTLDREKLIKALNSFVPEYLQKVPLYSAKKIHGKKLYEYARSGISVEVPEQLVQIKNIKLLDFNYDTFTFSVTVSSGTYIRSLINDIGKVLNIPMTMEELRRIKVGNYEVTMASSLDKIEIIPIIEALNMPIISIDDDNLLKKVSNGAYIDNLYQDDMILFTNDSLPIAIYQKDANNRMKAYRVFNNK